MKRQLKPWTLCARLCDSAVLQLLAAMPERGPFPDVAPWIAARTYWQLRRCDSIAAAFVQAQTGPSGRTYTWSTDDEWTVRWEFLLRLMFAVDVCRRMGGLRRQVPWTEPQPAQLRYLLIDLWRADALCWAWQRHHSALRAAH